MKTIILLIIPAVIIASCVHKAQFGYTTISKKIYTAAYHLYDSSYVRWNTSLPSFVFDTNYPLSRTIVIYMDSTEDYIAVNNDTFVQGNSFNRAGYYSYFGSPIYYDKIILTTDSVQFVKLRQLASHQLSEEISYGYRIP